MAGAETSCFDFLEYPLDNSGQQQQQPNPAVVASQGNPGTPKPVVSLEHTTVKQQQKQQQQPHSLGTSEQSRNPEKVQPNAVQSDTAAWKETSVEQQRSTLSNSELRRQIHIQSEQKRRAQIKDGFEDLRNELPSCLNKKMSKVALLHRTVQHIQHLKNTQATILAELERLVSENEQLRKFQEQVLQKQALAKMYPVNSL